MAETARALTSFTSEHFVAFIRAMVGQPYWMGTCLYRCTNDLLASKTEQYPTHYGSGRTARYKKDIATKSVAADCIGGLKGYMWTDGGVGVLESIGTGSDYTRKYGSNGCPDKGADSMYTYAKAQGSPCGSIDTLPETPGLAVRKKGHVGYYIGGGEVVEWKGFAYGCVQTHLTDTKWTDWYQIPFLQYESAPPESAETPTISSDTEGEQAPPEVSQTPDNAIGAPEVQPVSVTIVSSTGRVNIRLGPDKSYGRIKLVESGNVYPYIATAVNGWYALVIGKQVGWVDPGFSMLTYE